MDIAAQRELARLLAALRRDGRQQSGLAAALVPPDKATAYRVAGLVAEELGWPVLGWKIAAMKEEMQKALRTDQPIYGRVFFARETPASFVHAKLASPIPEVEYQARLGIDLPPRDKPYSQDEVTDAVASLHPGLELAECRFIHDAASRRCPRSWPTAPARARSSTARPSTDWKTRDIAGQEATLSSNGRLRRKGTGRRGARSPDGAPHLARQRTVAHRRRDEGGPDDQHRHADRHAGAQARRGPTSPTSARGRCGHLHLTMAGTSCSDRASSSLMSDEQDSSPEDC